MMKISKRQFELLNLVGFKIEGDNIIWKNDSQASIYYDEPTGLFNIKVKAHTFTPGDYDSVEYLAIDLNHMLGLIYELNSIRGGDSDEDQVCN